MALQCETSRWNKKKERQKKKHSFCQKSVFNTKLIKICTTQNTVHYTFLILQIIYIWFT